MVVVISIAISMFSTKLLFTIWWLKALAVWHFSSHVGLELCREMTTRICSSRLWLSWQWLIACQLIPQLQHNNPFTISHLMLLSGYPFSSSTVSSPSSFPSEITGSILVFPWTQSISWHSWQWQAPRILSLSEMFWALIACTNKDDLASIIETCQYLW